MATTSFPLQAGSSSGIFVKRLADALYTQGVDLEILVPCGNKTSYPNTAYPVRCFRYAPVSWQVLAHNPGGIPAMLKHRPATFLLVPGLVLALLANTWRSSKKADLIHANWSVAGILCGIAGRLRSTPVITTLRGSDVARLQHSMLTRLSVRLLLSLNAQVVTVSSSMRQELIRLLPRHRHKIVHIANGVEDRLLSIPLRRHPTPPLRVVSIGNLIPNKAVHDLLKAVAQAGPQKFHVHIVGDGEEKARLMALSDRLGLSKYVEFTGSLPPGEIASILGKANVFVLTSHREGRPNVVVEAMAAGCAPVVTNLPGTREMVTHKEEALLFQPGDHRQLAAHLLRLARDPALCFFLGKAARKKVIRDGLLWSVSANRYRHLYQKVIEHPTKCAV